MKLVGAWLAPLIVPPGIGVALIVAVMFRIGNRTITHSPGAAATALVVATILILGSAGLYILNPVWYDRFFTDLRTRFEGQHEDDAEPSGGTPSK